METGAVIIDLLTEGRLRRHLHIIKGGIIIGLSATNAEIRRGGLDQGFGVRDNLTFGQGGGIAPQAFGQSFALRDIKDCVALEKRDAPRILAGFDGAGLFGFRREAVGIHNGKAMFALTDISAKRQRLTEGQPVLCREIS